MERIPAFPISRWRLLLGGALSAGTVLLLLRIDLGPIPLTEQRVVLASSPDQIYQSLTRFGPSPRIVERGDSYLIAEFPITVGRYRVTTRERITLDPTHRQLTFEQLRSPFFSVRTAREVFELGPAPNDTTVLTVRGTLWPQLGVFGWLVTRQLVRPYWDRIEARHLAQLSQEVDTVSGQGDVSQ